MSNKISKIINTEENNYINYKTGATKVIYKSKTKLFKISKEKLQELKKETKKKTKKSLSGFLSKNANKDLISKEENVWYEEAKE